MDPGPRLRGGGCTHLHHGPASRRVAQRRRIAMSGHRKCEELSAQLRSDPERRARIEQGQQAIEAGLTISRLRETRGLTQENIAAQMGVTQSNVSHFERSPNVFVR